MANTPRCESLYVGQIALLSPVRAPTPLAQVRDTSPNSTPAPTHIFHMKCGGTVAQLGARIILHEQFVVPKPQTLRLAAGARLRCYVCMCICVREKKRVGVSVRVCVWLGVYVYVYIISHTILYL
jgi:hypothetical protein